MYSSALSTLAALLVLGNGSQLSADEQKSWKTIEPSLATIMRLDRPAGVAALISKEGLFIAHRSTFAGKQVKAKLSDGKLVDMLVMATDEATQLSLLKANDWIKSAKPLSAIDENPKPGQILLAALPAGLIRAEFVNADRTGLQNSRVLSLSEMQFEAPMDKIGGAVVMTDDGKIVGFLAMTLMGMAQEGVRAPVQKSGLRSSAETKRGNVADLQSPNRFGPADLTVAYSVAPSMVRRVVNSYRLGQTQVGYPTIGVFCKDNPTGPGALVETVAPNSPSFQAGIQPGDIILAIQGQPIKDQVELAKAVRELRPNADIKIRVKRGALEWLFPVRVGIQQD